MPTAPTSPPGPADFRSHVSIETPEQVELHYEIAGIGSRILAAIYDQAVIVAWTLAVFIVAAVTASGGGARAFWWILWGLGAFGYFIVFEAFRQGQTPGKRANGIRVVQVTGHPVTFGAAVARNLLRAADFLPAGYVLGSAMVMLHPSARRLGDLVAGTIVVRDRPEGTTEAEESGAESVSPARHLSGPLLTDEEFQVLGTFVERRQSLPPAVAERLAEPLAARLADRFPVRSANPVVFLLGLHRDETERRRTAGPLRGAGGAGRFAAGHAARWAEFEVLAGRAARGGLDSLTAAELPDFAARYREVSADLARARTYRAPDSTIQRLERLAAAGHNLLYRDRRRTFGDIGIFLFRGAPAAVIREWPAVLLGLVCLFGPAAAGWTVIRERPALAYEVLPDVMLDRAAAGRARSARGLGYFEASPDAQPLLAASIIGNNTRVAFLCFAGGVFLGVGSLILLGFNGLELGATAAHFANVGLFGYLGAFIVGHGALELIAIAVAGASGLILGLAIAAPGDHTRGDALMLASRRALPMVAAVAVMLAVAGTIEGLVSASDAGVTERLALSGASLLFLSLYLLNGWRHRRDGAGA